MAFLCIYFYFLSGYWLWKLINILYYSDGCESWTIKEPEHQRMDASQLWCWRRLLRVPWTASEIKPVNPTGNQLWTSIGRTAAAAEAPIFWPHDAKGWLIAKDPDASKDWGQEKKGDTKDEMIGWHHRHSGKTLGDSKGQESLVCCSPWGLKESNLTEEQQCLTPGCCSGVQSCTKFYDPMDCSTPGFSVLHCLPEFAQTHVHWVGDAIQPFRPLLSPSPVLHLCQYQSVSQGVGFWHTVGQNIAASVSDFPVNIQGWCILTLTGLISLQSSGLSRVFSNTTVQNISFFLLRLPYGQTLTSKHDCWKIHSFYYTDLCSKSDVSASYYAV